MRWLLSWCCSHSPATTTMNSCQQKPNDDVDENTSLGTAPVFSVRAGGYEAGPVRLCRLPLQRPLPRAPRFGPLPHAATVCVNQNNINQSTSPVRSKLLELSPEELVVGILCFFSTVSTQRVHRGISTRVAMQSSPRDRGSCCQLPQMFIRCIFPLSGSGSGSDPAFHSD